MSRAYHGGMRAHDPYSWPAAVSRQRPLAVVLLAIAIATALGLAGSARLAGLLLAVTLLAVGAARAGRSERELGALAIRGRAVDVTLYLGLGAVLGALAVSTPMTV